jgi:small GTP-binding protein
MAEESIYKVLLLGDTTVGKTCFLLKYTDKTFIEEHMTTIGLDYRLKTLKLKDGKEIKLQIWDTAGQERFRTITKSYYKGSEGILLIYDVTKRESFENVKTWVSQIREEVSKSSVIYVVGNKIDLEDTRKVTTEEGVNLAKELELPFKEASAKNGINIDETFYDLAEMIDKIHGNNQKVLRNISFIAKRRKCC